MINKEIYTKEPESNRILNQGVAEVAEDYSDEALQVLRYELETFICEGQYQRGFDKVLSTYLGALGSKAPEQKGVWISGFYGSGKSHMAKMLRVLWTDYEFPDGATARNLAKLPEDIKSHLKELSVQAQRNGGGLFAAAGKMGGGAGDSVRLILLGILYKAAGYPEQYAQARFLLWLRKEGKLDEFKAEIAAAGKELKGELANLYVSPHVAKALVKLFPGSFSDAGAVREALKANFKKPDDISDDELVEAIGELLGKDGKFPLTLIVLDELQQYIGSDASRAYRVQLVAETVCKHFKSQILFIGTGQAALNDTPNLQRLLARFPLPVQLSENDVDRVIRKIILAKKPSAEPELKAAIERRQGEISRHLQGTALAHTTKDDADLVADYPLLPTRRRFWEHVLRTVDPTGTTAQLRNQLRIVDEAVLKTADLPVGKVVGGDFVFDQIAESLVSSQEISRESYNRITVLSGSRQSEEVLMARLLKAVFLVNKLPRDASSDTKLRATADTVADLLVEDLDGDSAEIRRVVPALLERLAAEHALMSLEGERGIEYRLQTREGAEWNDEFRSQESRIRGSTTTVEIKRAERLKAWFAERKSSFVVRQGSSNEQRTAEFSWAPTRPTEAATRLFVWMRDGHACDEATALADARALKSEWPTVVVYLPDDFSNELFSAIVTYEAASATLQKKGNASGSEGEEARQSISAKMGAAEREIKEKIAGIIDHGKVWLAGGSEVTNGIGLDAVISSALAIAVERLYSHFGEADSKEWAKVTEKAQKGERDALKALGYHGDADKHPVCKAVLDEIGLGVKGTDLRSHFSDPPYGWSQDAVDGAIYVLLANELITASDSSNHSVTYAAATMPRAKIGQANFYREDDVLSPTERLALRSLFAEAKLKCAAGEESLKAGEWLELLKATANRGTGEAPLSHRTIDPTIASIEGLMGNKKLKAILANKDELSSRFKAWEKAASAAEQRKPNWELLSRLVALLDGLGGADSVTAEHAAILSNRSLLADPDPVEPLVARATDILRTAISERASAYETSYEALLTQLERDENWLKIPEGERPGIFASAGISAPLVPNVAGPDEVCQRLAERSLSSWSDLRDALPGRFEAARQIAIQRLMPKVVPVCLPKRIVKTEAELEAWLSEAKALIAGKLKDGPVSV